MNDKDLRVIKTKERIESAMLELLKNKPLDKITVTELARIAMINKGTFYLHYQDIFDLYRKIFLKCLEQPLANVNFFNLFFDEPERFLDALGKALMSGLPTLQSIKQPGQQDGMFFGDVCVLLRKKVYETHLIPKTLENDIKLDAVFSALLGIMPTYYGEHVHEAHRVIASLIRSQFPSESVQRRGTVMSAAKL